jgi:16S rRNA (cytosine1402-N4)-methyltransferase
MVAEILAILAPKPGDVAVDCTLGYGGHAREILARITPGGRLLGLDADPVELPKTEARLRALGFDESVFTAQRTNFAGMPQALAAHNLAGADVILADLGVSSMQIDDPARGFSVKFNGPLDMRMNPQRGEPVSAILAKLSPEALTEMLRQNADEPRADQLAAALAGQSFVFTQPLVRAIHAALPKQGPTEADLTVRRVFQALRIAANDEFSALETWLRHLPQSLKPGGRVAVLTFHSGEDRRVKKAFASGRADGTYARIAEEVTRPTPAEQHANPRSAPAKLRWAIRA